MSYRRPVLHSDPRDCRACYLAVRSGDSLCITSSTKQDVFSPPPRLEHIRSKIRRKCLYPPNSTYRDLILPRTHALAVGERVSVRKSAALGFWSGRQVCTDSYVKITMLLTAPLRTCIRWLWIFPAVIFVLLAIAIVTALCCLYHKVE